MTGAVAVAVAVLFQTSPVVLGRALDAQTGEPAARGAVVVDGGTAGGARSEAASAVATGQAPRRVDALITANGDASVGRRVDVAGGSVDLGAIRLNRESAVVYGRVGVRRAPVPD